MISPSGQSSTQSERRYYSPCLGHSAVLSRTSSRSSGGGSGSDNSRSTCSSEKNSAVSPQVWFAAAESSSVGGEFESSVASTDYNITVKDPPRNETLNEAMVNTMVVGRGNSAEVAEASSSAPGYIKLGYPKRPEVVSGFRRVKPGDFMTVSAQIKPAAAQRHLRLVTVDIAKAYQAFSYESRQIPRRVLTQPGKPAKNDGVDNKDDDYIIRVNDVLGEGNKQYRVIDILGSGAFGQVVKCEWIQAKKVVSIKIIKNRLEFTNQSYSEVDILKRLDVKLPAKDRGLLLQLYHSFDHKNHLCIAYELLSYSLYELLKQNKFRGLPINMIRRFTIRLLETLVLLKDAMVIHCDLKPENILLKSVNSPEIKVIDYGSAAHANMPRSITYIQSRFYRSPEVILGLPFTYPIDMWSLGCVVAELFIGAPLLPGMTEQQQLSLITDMFGMPPEYMLVEGTKTKTFYGRQSLYSPPGKSSASLGLSPPNGTHGPGKSTVTQAQHIKPNPYDSGRPKVNLADVIINYDGSSFAERAHKQMLYQTTPLTSLSKQELDERHTLVDFLQGLLAIDPKLRWTPMQALGHPFVTGEPFLRPYILPPVASKKMNTNMNDSPAIVSNRPATITSPANISNTSISALSSPTPAPHQSNDNSSSLKPAAIEKGKSILPTSTSPIPIPGIIHERNTRTVESPLAALPMPPLLPATVAVKKPQSPQPIPIIKHRHSIHPVSIMKISNTLATGNNNNNAQTSPQRTTMTVSTANAPSIARRVKIDPMVKLGSKEQYRMPDETESTTKTTDYDGFASSSQGLYTTSFYSHLNKSTSQLLNSNNSSSAATYVEESSSGRNRSLYRTLSSDKLSNNFGRGGGSSRHAGVAAPGIRMVNKRGK